jgi:cephalosporin hydroxylase
MSTTFEVEKQRNIRRLAEQTELRSASVRWLTEVLRYNYSHHFTWLGRPIIQCPQDVLAVQEIIYAVRPELIVETGVAHGGSLILSASILELLGGERRVVGVDIDIRPHNRQAIEAHPLSHRILLRQGSSTDPQIAAEIAALARGKRTMVLLDSNHTHTHVAEELRLYSPLVGQGSYLVVFDTIIEDMPADLSSNRPWGKGDNPATAVADFLQTNDRFEVDQDLEAKLLITVAPGGYLKCVKD